MKTLIKEKEAVAAEIKTLPNESIIVTKDKNNTKWYIKNTKETLYLPKKNRILASKLAYKKYLEYRLSDINQEIKAINSYNNNYRKANKAEKLLADNRYKELLFPYFNENPSYARNCETAFTKNKENIKTTKSYNSNPIHPENLTHSTLKGHMVRSKSEESIANLLYMNKIPYQYEAELNLNGITLYPDFTIQHPANHNLFYWEHFGIMDDKLYMERYKKKIEFYTDNGILLSKNLIATYETANVSLDCNYVQHLIEYYFK